MRIIKGEGSRSAASANLFEHQRQTEELSDTVGLVTVLHEINRHSTSYGLYPMVAGNQMRIIARTMKKMLSVPSIIITVISVTAVSLAMLSSCGSTVVVQDNGNGDGPPPGGDVSVVVRDDYVYYPNYGVYYNSYRGQYYYQEQGAWVARPGPPGVSVNVLLASPSVRMDFHDAPQNHHAAMAQRYPRGWNANRQNENQHEHEERR